MEKKITRQTGRETRSPHEHARNIRKKVVKDRGVHGRGGGAIYLLLHHVCAIRRNAAENEHMQTNSITPITRGKRLRVRGLATLLLEIAKIATHAAHLAGSLLRASRAGVYQESAMTPTKQRTTEVPTSYKNHS